MHYMREAIVFNQSPHTHDIYPATFNLSGTFPSNIYPYNQTLKNEKLNTRSKQEESFKDTTTHPFFKKTKDQKQQEEYYPFQIVNYNSNTIQYKNKQNQSATPYLNKADKNLQAPSIVQKHEKIHSLANKNSIHNSHDLYEGKFSQLEVQPWSEDSHEVTKYQNNPQKYRSNPFVASNSKSNWNNLSESKKNIYDYYNKQSRYHSRRSRREEEQKRFLPVSTTNQQKMKWKDQMQSMVNRRRKISNILKMRHFGHNRFFTQDGHPSILNKSEPIHQSPHKTIENNTVQNILKSPHKYNIALLKTQIKQPPQPLKSYSYSKTRSYTNTYNPKHKQSIQIKHLYSVLKSYTQRSKITRKQGPPEQRDIPNGGNSSYSHYRNNRNRGIELQNSPKRQNHGANSSRTTGGGNGHESINIKRYWLNPNQNKKKKIIGIGNKSTQTILDKSISKQISIIIQKNKQRKIITTSVQKKPVNLNIKKSQNVNVPVVQFSNKTQDKLWAQMNQNMSIHANKRTITGQKTQI